MILVPQPAGLTRFVTTVLSLAAFLFIFSPYNPYKLTPTWGIAPPGRTERPRLTEEELGSVEARLQWFIDKPVVPPYKDKFAVVGGRAREFRNASALVETSANKYEKRRLERAIEAAAPWVFPFLQNPPRNPESETPLADLRATFEPGSRGIVLPTGSETLRFAYHLLASLRGVLNCTLPVEIAYAGDDDLTPAEREEMRAHFDGLAFLNVLEVFDGETLGLQGGRWAIKAFAALGSSFEEVILVDADAVFLQPPEILLAQEAYQKTGALLFRDRLLFMGAFKSRHEWWESQVRHPSAMLNTSLAFTQGYGEEGDSGVVVLNKGRSDILFALLHIAWQNTEDVRATTYTMGHGDKESWWFGLELSGSPYAFEKHYASMVGWPADTGDGGETTICSFGIAHLDEQERLLWYNGGLLRNKKADPKTFALPTHWMVDGVWTKGDKVDKMSCMAGKDAMVLSTEERETLLRSMGLAQWIDIELGFV